MRADARLPAHLEPGPLPVDRPAWYEGPNWRGPGYCHYVDLVYDVLLDPARDALLPREALRSGRLARMHWDTQSSGVRIPDEVVAQLERTWGSLSRGG
jgi:hypothetical protein